jgi:aryl-alcohol dehydrogenase-like predicted oxidoreductase
MPESVVICGAKRPSQIIGNIEGMDWRLNDADLRILDSVSVAKSAA